MCCQGSRLCAILTNHQSVERPIVIPASWGIAPSPTLLGRSPRSFTCGLLIIEKALRNFLIYLIFSC